MKKEEMRLSLINATIRIISRGGLDKATTKSIATEANLNEVYIYRNFSDKEDLFVKTFNALDNELLSAISKNVSVMWVESIAFTDRCRILFDNMWNFLISNKERCLCYIYYFYSPYFASYSIDTHRTSYENIVQLFTPAFVEGTDVWMLLNHMLDVILSFAVKVHTGQLEDTLDNRYHIFNVIYQAVKAYLRYEQNKNTTAV